MTPKGEKQQHLISVFVPCYNEEKRLEKNILQIYDALKALKKSFELVIVDDGSTDATPALAQKLASLHKKIRHQRHDTGPSRRENLGRAFRIAKGEIILFMDLDLSVPLSFIPRLLEGITAGNDIVIGSRYKGIQSERGLQRSVISRIYNTFMRLYFGSNIQDHQCGFKAFKREALFSLLDDMGYDEKFVRGWFWDVELLLRAQKKGYKIDEFPVSWNEGKQSSFDFKRELKMLPYVLKLQFRF